MNCASECFINLNIYNKSLKASFSMKILFLMRFYEILLFNVFVCLSFDLFEKKFSFREDQVKSTIIK